MLWKAEKKVSAHTYIEKKHTNNATLDKNKRYALTFEGISHPYLSP